MKSAAWDPAADGGTARILLTPKIRQLSCSHRCVSLRKNRLIPYWLKGDEHICSACSGNHAQRTRGEEGSQEEPLIH